MLIDSCPAVLVKEIRQGLKTKSFALTLVGQQTLMVITILFYLLGVRAGNDISFANGLFWFCLGVPLLAVMPARGFMSIHEERSTQTLELLFLTRLSARQIVVGKWTALFTQTLLIVVATLPYMVIRYFIGGIDISTDLSVTGWLTLASAVLIAVGIGFSAVETKAIRVLIVLLAVLSAFPGFSFMMMMFAMRRGMGSGPIGVPKAGVIMSVIALSLLVGAYALFFGASLIAAPAENHAKPKRLLGLLGVVLITILAVVANEDSMMAFVFPLLVLVGADALTEVPPRVWSVYAKRDGSRWPLPFAMRPFLPGWPSGLIYLLLISLFSWVTIAVFFGSDLDNAGALMIALVMGVLFPLPVVLLLGSRLKRIAPVYILLQIIHIALSVLMMTAVSTHTLGDATAAGLLPAATFMVTAANENGMESAILLLCMLMGGGVVVVLLKARRVWESLRQLEPIESRLTATRNADAS